MYNVAGGWTVDQGYIDIIEENNLGMTLFKFAVVKAVRAKLAAIEIAGTLSTSEKQLSDNFVNSLDRIVELIRPEAKYVARGQACPFSDVQVMINNQWANILKRYV